MVIKNPDGTPYELSCFKFFDKTASFHNLFNDYNQELAKIGGSPIYYYEAIIPPSTIDPVYWESRGMLYSDQYVVFHAYYEPFMMKYQDMFALHPGTDTQIFKASYNEVISAIGHPPKLDSRIYTPHKGENWKIVNCITGGYEYWGELTIEIICDKFQENLETGEGQVTSNNPT